MKALFVPITKLDISSNRASIALLALRVVAGVAFILHGSGKIVHPFNWMGPDAPVPGIFQALAALAEFGGGIAWLLGLLTPLVSIGLLATMAVAALTHIGKGDAFVGGYELALVYFVIAGLLLLVGPGRFSVDAALASKRREGSDSALGKTQRSSVA